MYTWIVDGKYTAVGLPVPLRLPLQRWKELTHERIGPTAAWLDRTMSEAGTNVTSPLTWQLWQPNKLIIMCIPEPQLPYGDFSHPSKTIGTLLLVCLLLLFPSRQNTIRPHRLSEVAGFWNCVFLLPSTHKDDGLSGETKTKRDSKSLPFFTSTWSMHSAMKKPMSESS